MTLIRDLNTVEIEVNSRCNRKCNYCPVSVLPIPSVPRYMDNRVFCKLLDELAIIDFSGRVSYHFYNEPLLHPGLEKIVRQVALRLPNAWQVLFTNGDLLTDERYKTMLEAGINLFLVTSHSLRPPPTRPFQQVQFPRDLHLTNRGGTMANLPEVTPDFLVFPCYAPSEMLIVTATGDVVLCYEDAMRQYVMGNILNNSLEEIWFSDGFVQIRRLLAQGRRGEASAICRLCTNIAHQIPGTSYIPTP